MMDASSLPLMDDIVDVDIDQFDNDDDQEVIMQSAHGSYIHHNNSSSNSRKPEKAKWTVQEDR